MELHSSTLQMNALRITLIVLFLAGAGYLAYVKTQSGIIRSSVPLLWMASQSGQKGTGKNRLASPNASFDLRGQQGKRSAIKAAQLTLLPSRLLLPRPYPGLSG
jgi:hypothetical protein